MLFFAFLPEITTFLLFILMSIQDFTLGPILVAIEILLFVGLVVVRPLSGLSTALRWWPLLLTPILATLSCLWSTVPDASLRYGVQFLFTAFIGVHLARLISPRRLVSVVMTALFVFLIMCIISGKRGSSADGLVLIGLTGSKNQISYAGQLLVMSALTVILQGRSSPLIRWIAVLSLPLGAYILAATDSATGVLMAVGGSFALLALWVSQRLSPGGRLGAVIAAALVLAPLAALTPEIRQGINHFVFDTLNKDPTLTGRTVLWEHADALVAQRPVLGWGYQAIWMGHSSETIGLERLTGITEGRAFHFHNTFRQVAVDTGFIGLAVFVAILTISFFKGLAQALLHPRPEVAFFFMIVVLMIARAFTDLIIGPFSIHTILLYASLTYMFSRPEIAAAQDQPFAWLNSARALSAQAPQPQHARTRPTAL
jgi:exopolysaccharide production protein ExoQ